MASPRNSLLAGFFGLSRNLNKAGGRNDDETVEGVVGDLLPELTLDLDEEDLIDLSDSWEKTWNDSAVKTQFVEMGDENENYWKGNHYEKNDLDKTRSIKDNAIFEGLETYLPMVTRRNPDPMVTLAAEEDQTLPGNQDFVQALQHELGDLADELTLRLKLKTAARHKELYLLGVAKGSWDLDNDRPSIKIVRPRKIILDPEATVDEDGYSGERIGEIRKMSASKLLKFEGQLGWQSGASAYITEQAKGNLATDLQFIEWWTPDYTFWKMGDRVLRKMKNPHWNYDEMAQALDKAVQEAAPEAANSDEMGPGETQPPQTADTSTPAIPSVPGDENTPAPTPAPEPRKGVNHYRTRRMPYVLLATFTLGKQPVDITSNIGQNLSNQDLINKRIRQIDKNADSMNQGLVVSLERSGLTKDEARQVTEALRKGGTVVIPAGDPNAAVTRMPTPGLPADVYNQLVDTRNRVRDIWGTRGSTPAGIQNEDTVRGKLIVQGLDTDRIGGSISEYLEQFADQIYNLLTQLLYVYDDRFADAIKRGIPIPRVKVSVKEGSLLPKDSTTIANQAIELSGAGKMSTLDLYKRLDYPNATELAVNAWLETNAPDVLYADDPRVQQVIQAKQQAAAAAQQVPPKSPTESISFKDLPPDGKVQLAAQAGIHLDPALAMVHEAAKITGGKGPAAPATQGQQPVEQGQPPIPQINQ